MSYDRAKEYSLHSVYVKALLKEIAHYAKTQALNDYLVDTIFIGGGTPTILAAEEIAEILTACRKSFHVKEDAEITIESNPGTLTEEKLDAYLKMGINRLSIGVQSFDNRLLESLGRIHSKEDFLENYKKARMAGFSNINIDLMFGLPEQSEKLWLETLEQAIALDPEHISFYSLQIEEGTPFYKMHQEGTLTETDDLTDRKMYRQAIDKLTKNAYLPYEISNAAKAGCLSKHNLKYWSLVEYLGLGLGSHSYFQGYRFSNETDLTNYIEQLNVHERTQHFEKLFDPKESPVVVWSHKNTRKEDIAEYLFTGLRRREGISRQDFYERFAVSVDELFEKEIKGHLQNGLMENSSDGGFLRLTADGVDLSNSVMADFV